LEFAEGTAAVGAQQVVEEAIVLGVAVGQAVLAGVATEDVAAQGAVGL
jgi:hypothetical protein